MLIYDKKDNNIDIYSIEAKKEELKKYRKSILEKHKEEQLFYGLRTNRKDIIEEFCRVEEIGVGYLRFNNRPYFEDWARLALMKDINTYDNKTQKEILEEYINGEYDAIRPTRTIYKDANEKITEFNRLLRTDEVKQMEINKKYSKEKVWKIENMIDLPRSLYLLHLLLHGYFSKLTSENITRQLKLFEIDYLRSVKISDINDMISTGLVDGTIEQAIQKAEIGSLILQKIKK